MAAAPPVELVGIVVRVADLGEADRIVEIVTAERGRVSLVARGGRASRRRFAGALDLFETLRVQARARGALWQLIAADVLAARLPIRGSLVLLDRAARLVATARGLANELEPSPEVFTALTWGLDRLAAGAVDEATLAYPRLLTGAGIGPDYDRCMRCGQRAPATLALEAREGQALCPRCGTGPQLRAALFAWPPIAAPTALEAAELERDCLAWVEQQTGRAPRWSRSLR